MRIFLDVLTGHVTPYNNNYLWSIIIWWKRF